MNERPLLGFRRHRGAQLVLLACCLLCAWDAAAGVRDIREVQPDLTIPALEDAPPAAGKRVKTVLNEYAETQVYHVLYLPTDWTPEGCYPVLVEYAGNGPYQNQFGDVSTGRPEGSKLGYGISGGEGFIWVCLPYLSAQSTIQTQWWGDVSRTLDYGRKAIRDICERFGGDPSAVLLAGFSRHWVRIFGASRR